MFNALERINSFLERTLDDDTLSVAFIPSSFLVDFFAEKEVEFAKADGEVYQLDFTYESKLFRISTNVPYGNIIIEYLGEE